MPGHQLNIRRRPDGLIAQVTCSCGLRIGLEAEEGQKIANGTAVFAHFMLEMAKKAREQQRRQRPS